MCSVSRIFRNHAQRAFLCLPLATAIFWQGSSCNDSKMNANSINATNQTQDSSTQTEIRGQWGGQGISLEIGDGTATIEYDCAHGTITEKIVADSSGRFVARGFHVRERPGPTREGEDDTKGQPATYTGSIEGQTMRLTVTLSDTNKSVGTFGLTKGKKGPLRKCA